MTGPDLAPVTKAFEQKDYRRAQTLLKALYQHHPKDPSVQLYIGRLQEASKRPDKAEATYRKLLKATTNSKIISQARQGLKRIESQEKEQRQAAIAQATQNEHNTALGCLILEPIANSADKQKAIPAFARLMELEPYSARLLLPSRTWRFYRTGPIGLLEVYVKELKAINVPAFCVSLEELATYDVIRANHLAINNNQITAQLLPEPSQAEAREAHKGHDAFQFSCGAVGQCIEGALPIFELVVDTGLKQGRLGPKKATLRKETIKDYAKVLDLHLPKQKKMVRLCDRDYNYPTSASSAVDQRYAPIAQRWQRLLAQQLKPALSHQPWHEHRKFTAFGETVIEQTPFLQRIDPHIRVTARATMTARADEELWDPAFQLYSCLQLWKYTQSLKPGQ